MPKTRFSGTLWQYILFSLILTGLFNSYSRGSVVPTVTETFTNDTDNYWVNQNTRVASASNPNNFGWSDTHNVDGSSAPLGEFGGTFSRSQAVDPLNPQPSEAVVYYYNIASSNPANTITNTDEFGFSGNILFDGRTNASSGTRIGFFLGTNSWVGPYNFFGILLNGGVTPQIQLYDNSGNLDLNSAATATSGGLIPSTGSGAALTAGTTATFSFFYNGTANGGNGTVTFQVNSVTPLVVNLTAAENAALANYTSFGILNPRAAVGGTVTEYFDDLTFSSYNPIPVPEPGSLFIIGVASLLGLSRQRARQLSNPMQV